MNSKWFIRVENEIQIADNLMEIYCSISSTLWVQNYTTITTTTMESSSNSDNNNQNTSLCCHCQCQYHHHFHQCQWLKRLQQSGWWRWRRWWCWVMLHLDIISLAFKYLRVFCKLFMIERLFGASTSLSS